MTSFNQTIGCQGDALESPREGCRVATPTENQSLAYNSIDQYPLLRAASRDPTELTNLRA